MSAPTKEIFMGDGDGGYSPDEIEAGIEQLYIYANTAGEKPKQTTSAIGIAATASEVVISYTEPLTYVKFPAGDIDSSNFVG